MRVLHYIYDFNSEVNTPAYAVRMMMTAISRIVDVHLVTVVPLSEYKVKELEEQCNIKVCYLHSPHKKAPFNVVSTYIEFKEILRKLSPDIVHVHGSWDLYAAVVERVARHQRVVTLVSPHNGMSQELFYIDFWSKKLPRLILYQLWMIRNCTAVIAISDKESTDIKSIGLRKRIEVLPQIPRDKEYMEPLRTALSAYYRKALDSCYMQSLTEKEKHFVTIALRSVIADEDSMPDMPDNQDVSYRRIYFHAYDEDVMEQFVEGCNKLHVSVPPPLDVAEVPRYKNPKAKPLGTLADVPIPQKHLKLPADRTAERDAVLLISKANRLTIPKLTLRHYAELYAMFRHSDFDEDIVAAELKRLHLLRFTAKIQKRLSDMFGLKQGYNII